MLPDPPALSAAVLTAYWSTVALKSILILPRIQKLPNVLPREPLGRAIRIVWVPLIAAWLTASWGAAGNPAPFPALAWTGFILATAALALSFWCWKLMGDSWRIGIDPHEKTRLVVEGAYRHVRHPIYSLSILLAWGTAAATQTAALAAIAAAHTVLMLWEAIREERHLLRIHGDIYRDYLRTTGRFLPRAGK